MSVFSMNLTKTRKLANITRKEMAEKIGVSLGVNANYENGDREPRLNTLVKIASVLKVSLDTFFNYAPEVNEQERIISELINLGLVDEIREKEIVLFCNKDEGCTFTVPKDVLFRHYKEIKLDYSTKPLYTEGFKYFLRINLLIKIA